MKMSFVSPSSARVAVLMVVAALTVFLPRASAQSDAPLELAAFDGWTRTHTGTVSPAALAEGTRLARERTAVLAKWARNDPARVLAASVPAAVRAKLPAPILRELETPFSAVGDYTTYCELRAIAGPKVKPSRQEVRFGGHVYPAYVYGRRAGMTTKQNIFLHGVLIGNEAVLDENVLRALPEAEAALETRTPRDLSASSAASTGRAALAEAGGTLYRFASDAHLHQAEAALRDLESHRTPETANADEPNALEHPDTVPHVPDSDYTTGNKQVLVIRVDFSDFAGDPSFRGTTMGTVAQAQNIADTQVKPYYVRSSFNLTSLTTTVTTKLYRMPRTAADYAQHNDNYALHTDAENAAAADYDVNSYDRLLVLFSFLGDLSNSQIGYGGLAEVGSKRLWVNGEFDFRVVAHELGHTYGLIHANLWQISSGSNPISTSGSSTEYGDDYDTMGANYANSQACDFNVWYKQQLDWVPAAKVKKITASGTYRVYQFDGGAAGGNLALVFPKDDTRNYWVSIRRNAFNFTNNMAHGVYLTWGYNSTFSNENLIDILTPGSDDTDAGLTTGSTLTDAASSITITPVAEGGTAPNMYEDVKINLDANVAPPVVNSAGSASGTVNTAFSYQITATNSPTSYGASDLPGGLSVNTSTGVISGKPSEDGTFTVTITATNTGGTGSKTLTLTIAKSPNAPTITNFSPKSGPVGSSVTITGTHFAAPLSIQFAGNVSAAGSFSPTQITVTVPSGALTGPITVYTSDGSAMTASDFVVTNPDSPVITSIGTADATQGKAFSYQITATKSPTRFGAVGLPPGLKVNALTGVISGTPTTSGKKTLTLKAINASGTGEKNLTIDIAEALPVITSAGTASGKVGTAFSYRITTPYQPVRFSVLGLAPGLHVNATTGVISGTPTKATTFSMTLQAINDTGKGTKTLKLTVTN